MAGDRQRCKEAGVPADRAKAVVTKPELGRRLEERARCAGVPFVWVAVDTVYGQDRKLRAGLERHGKGYVMAVPRDETVDAGWLGSMRVDLLLPQLRLVFERRSCRKASKPKQDHQPLARHQRHPPAVGNAPVTSAPVPTSIQGMSSACSRPI
ncbi:transposase [Streptomyces sp. NPDC055709]